MRIAEKKQICPGTNLIADILIVKLAVVEGANTHGAPYIVPRWDRTQLHLGLSYKKWAGNNYEDGDEEKKI